MQGVLVLPMDTTTRSTRSERGSALIWALLFVVITSGMVIAHTIYLAANRRDMDVRFRQTALATNLARSGALDALRWFQKQPTQPVTGFAPKSDPGADPPLLDTLDPSLGLVREFEVRGSLWGRYEVRNDEVVDISRQRHETTPGTVWDLGARGLLYERNDPNKRFDEAPNRIVAITRVHTEMRGVPILPPSQAAICVPDDDQLVIGPKGHLDGKGRPAVAHDPARVDVLAAVPPEVRGLPPQVTVPGYDASPEKMFKMPLDVMRSLSDRVVTGPGDLPKHPITDQIVFAPGNLTLPAGKPLRGRMLLIVDGDLTVEDGNGSNFTGIVFVTGKALIRGAFQLAGSLIAGSEVRIGEGTEKVDIGYDQGAIDQLRAELGRYRTSRGLYQVK